MTFQQVASVRRGLRGELSGLGLRRYLPASLVSDLAGAWQASEQVDPSYARWAGDETRSGCVPQDYTDQGYTAAARPSRRGNMPSGVRNAGVLSQQAHWHARAHVRLTDRPAG
jgi:hypothetical protein